MTTFFSSLFYLILHLSQTGCPNRNDVYFFLFTVHVTELTFDIFCSLLRCSVSARIHAGNSQWGQDLYQIAFEFVFPWDFTRYFTIFKNNYNNGIKL